tara:strand:- start:272 stop:1837 length:1566 start_codon:yes stop_codon:yes gene_type:complete
MAINTGAAVKSTNEGFLSPDINVQSDFGLGAQSALLTKEDLKPSQPYQLTTVQDTIPAAPPVAVRDSYDPYSDDLESIISPFTDAEAIKERRKKEEAKRKQIRPTGDTDALFEVEPTLNIGTPEVPQLKVDTQGPVLQMMPGPSKDLTQRVKGYEEKEIPQENIKDPFAIDIGDAFKESVSSPAGVVQTAKLGAGVTQALSTGYDAFASDLLATPAQQAYLKALPSEAARVSAEGLMKSANTDPTLAYKTISKLGLTDEVKTATSYINKLYDPAKEAISKAWYGTGEGNVGLSTAWTDIKSNIADDLSGVKDFYDSPMGQNIMKGAGTALAVYSAYNAFKAGDTLGGVASSLSAVAMWVPGLQPIALALTAASFLSGVTGFGRGKSKPGMGGSEIRYNKDTGQLEHGTTWSYNGFNPSQAKQHTDQAVKFVNQYMKEFNISLNPEKFPQGQSNWQFLSRIDVSPYRNGSQSAGELIERWMSSGAFTGNPSYYDPNSGERRFFTSQEEYEKAVSRFANKVFS